MARIRVRKSLIVDMSEDEAVYTLDAIVEKMQHDRDVPDWAYKFAQSFAESLDVDIETQSEDDVVETEDNETDVEEQVPTHAPGKSRTNKKG